MLATHLRCGTSQGVTFEAAARTELQMHSISTAKAHPWSRGVCRTMGLSSSHVPLYPFSWLSPRMLGWVFNQTNGSVQVSVG